MEPVCPIPGRCCCLEVLEARREREAASLAAWELTAAQLGDSLPAFHRWLHIEHLCYAVARQVAPINGCQMGTNNCIMHPILDQVIGFSDGRVSKDSDIRKA
jgi:hypothetical protein